MRVLHLLDRETTGGGIETYVAHVAPALTEQGVEAVTAYLSDGSGGGGATPGRVRIGGLGELARWLSANDIDVVHTHRLVSADLRSRTGRPLVRTVHGHHPYCPSGTKFHRRLATPCRFRAGVGVCTAGHLIGRCGSVRPARLARSVSRWRGELRSDPDHYLTMSAFVRTEMARAGYPLTQITALALPVQAIEVPGPTRDGPLVFAGRLTATKGLEWALRSLAEAPPEICLVVLGDGPLRGSLEALCRRLDIADRVAFHGWVPPADVRRELEDCRAAIVPSLWQEPAGYSALEAFAVGRPVIASRVGGLQEVAVQGQTAVVVEPNDRRGLTEAMTRVHGDRDLCAHLGRAGWELVMNHHGLTDHVRLLAEVYRSVAA